MPILWRDLNESFKRCPVAQDGRFLTGVSEEIPVGENICQKLVCERSRRKVQPYSSCMAPGIRLQDKNPAFPTSLDQRHDFLVHLKTELICQLQINGIS